MDESLLVDKILARPSKEPHIGFQDPISIVLLVDNTRIKTVPKSTTTQHYAATHKDSFDTKSVDFCYVGRMKTSTTFYLDEDSTRITLPYESRLITEKKMPPFLGCPRLMFSAPQYSVVPVECSQRDTQDWTPGVKDSLCKMAVESLPGNSSSRHQQQGRKYADKSLSAYVALRLRLNSDPVQMSILCGDLD
ncbi:hypothetical protein TNCV_78591 [Trichonephila clavipes]|nr:hypothetical protein TNCV_78591 [Trichonephila clavipes]